MALRTITKQQLIITKTCGGKSWFVLNIFYLPQLGYGYNNYHRPLSCWKVDLIWKHMIFNLTFNIAGIDAFKLNTVKESATYCICTHLALAYCGAYMFAHILLSLYSLSRRTSYPKISWSLEGSSAISQRHDHYNIQSRGFETSQDLAVRRLTA